MYNLWSKKLYIWILFVLVFQKGKGEFDTILVATGRKSLTEELNPAAAGLQLQPNSGKIHANAEQTNVPNIYAVGDILHVCTINKNYRDK